MPAVDLVWTDPVWLGFGRIREPAEGGKLLEFADGSLLSWRARDAAQVVQPSRELVRQLALSGNRRARELAVRLTARLR